MPFRPTARTRRTECHSVPRQERVGRNAIPSHGEFAFAGWLSVSRSARDQSANRSSTNDRLAAHGRGARNGLLSDNRRTRCRGDRLGDHDPLARSRRGSLGNDWGARVTFQAHSHPAAGVKRRNRTNRQAGQIDLRERHVDWLSSQPPADASQDDRRRESRQRNRLGLVVGDRQDFGVRAGVEIGDFRVKLWGLPGAVSTV